MPYWDDGSGQSKKEYDAGGGYDHHGNQNITKTPTNNNNPNPHIGPTAAEIAAAKAKKEAEKKALEDAKYETWLTNTKEKKKKKTDWVRKSIDVAETLVMIQLQNLELESLILKLKII